MVSLAALAAGSGASASREGAASVTTPTTLGAITVLSNRADLISGGDALVAIELGDADAASVKVLLNGTDVTGAFAVRENGRYEGLVTGLTVGENVLIARPTQGQSNDKKGKPKNGNGIGRQITIRNHPIGGPVFAGPQVTPFFCNPNVVEPAAGRRDRRAVQCADQGGPPLPEHRHAGGVRRVRLRQPAACVIDRHDDDRCGEDGALHRPAGHGDCGSRYLPDRGSGRPQKPIEPWSTTQPWSHKLFYTFGGACGNQHTQTAPGSVLQATQLGLGFAVGDLEPEHLCEQLQRPRLGRGGRR